VAVRRSPHRSAAAVFIERLEGVMSEIRVLFAPGG
jgi:hypothetical protein